MSTFWSGRLESNQHEEVGSLPRSHYATPALVSRASPSREGTTDTDWGDRRDSNSLTADSQSARAPYCVRPPRSGGPSRIRTGAFLRDKQARTAWLLYESEKRHTGSGHGVETTFRFTTPRSDDDRARSDERRHPRIGSQIRVGEGVCEGLAKTRGLRPRRSMSATGQLPVRFQ
jgi:hypothetical protein